MTSIWNQSWGDRVGNLTPLSNLIVHSSAQTPSHSRRSQQALSSSWLVHTYQYHLTFRDPPVTSIPIDSLPSIMPPFSLYSTWHNLKSPHPLTCSPVSIECESEVMGPCVSLVTAVSPESPVCLTPVSPQKQLLRTNGERRDLGSALDGVTALLSISGVHPSFHTEGWQQFRKCPGVLWGNPGV